MRARKYFGINEESARAAHNMMSFRDYAEGSLTAEYQGYCNKAYNLADEVAEERPEEAERVYLIAEQYAKKMADNLNDRSRIGCMCPSVLISGAGNFPVRKKEKQNVAAYRNYLEWNEIQKLLDKIKSIANGKGIIKSGDTNAVEKLEKKLEELKTLQAKMKAANKALRMKDTKKGNTVLQNMGYSDAEIKKLREPDYLGRAGYPSFMLQNNNANIHRVEGRLEKLKAEKENVTDEKENEYFKIVENTGLMRLQLFFDGKPDPEIRDVLKKNGFRWSPRNACWQRQLTDNARWSLKRVIEQLDKM